MYIYVKNLSQRGISSSQCQYIERMIFFLSHVTLSYYDAQEIPRCKPISTNSEVQGQSTNQNVQPQYLMYKSRYTHYPAGIPTKHFLPFTLTSNCFFHFQACQWVTEQGIKNSGVIREQASNVKAVGCQCERKTIRSSDQGPLKTLVDHRHSYLQRSFFPHVITYIKILLHPTLNRICS